MAFDVAFGVALTLVAAGFVVVLSLIVYRGVRSARDPEYRAQLAARPPIRSSTHLMTPPTLPDPTPDPGNPASPMFPGNPGNPI